MQDHAYMVSTQQFLRLRLSLGSPLLESSDNRRVRFNNLIAPQDSDP